MTVNLRITVKRYAHLQTLTKTPAKFQKYTAKTHGGVAFTRLATFCDRQTDAQGETFSILALQYSQNP